MPALPGRRASQCLFCTLAAKRPSPPQRLLPPIQAAYRSKPAGYGRRQKRVEERHYDHGRARPQDSRIIFDRTARSPFNPSFLRPRRSPVLAVLVPERLERLHAQLTEPGFLDSLGLTRETFDQQWAAFEASVGRWTREPSSERKRLEEAAELGYSKLDQRLRYLFYAQTFSGRFTRAELDNQKEVADLRYPSEWYPATREIPRKVHLHVGPTNSGKTYHALKRLEEAEKGIYLGPLRLLAHEVYTRLNAKGKPCALVTGEEQRLPEEEPQMWSCTVEMAPLNTLLDVAVIDEIQMIGNVDRGWAWTQAFLGVKAKEVHLCGEARTVPLIRELCALIGDKVQVHEYKRLTPLAVAPRSLGGNLAHLEKGDCIVAFSVLGIHALRREVEKQTGKKCAIVYGSLPPETRAQQARLFNDPDNDYDYLVASDAIGMGLNLSIKRVIFESTMKNNGVQLVPLKVSDIKQIAGRAGRYRTAHQDVSQSEATKTGPALPSDVIVAPGDEKEGTNDDTEPTPPPTGIVTTLEQFDFKHLKAGMESEPEPIKTAGLFPPSLIIERFANYFPPGTPFSYILLRLHEISKIHTRFHLCTLRDQLGIADTIHTVKNLSIADRITICAAPTNVRDPAACAFLRTLAECIAYNKSGELLELPNLPLEILDQPTSSNREYLFKLEQLHKMLVIYLWLSYRFPNVFTTRSLANHTKGLVEDAIEDTLLRISWTEQAKEAIRRKREKARRKLELEEKAKALVEDEESGLNTTSNVPEAVEDVLNDDHSFAEGSGPVDDEGEYPMEELEVLEPSETEHLDRLERGLQEDMKTPSHLAQNSLPTQLPPTTERPKTAETTV